MNKTIGIIAGAAIVAGTGFALISGDVSADSVYEKVDDNTIKVTTEVSTDIKVNQLLAQKQYYEGRIADLNKAITENQTALDEVNKLLAEAEKLGIE